MCGWAITFQAFLLVRRSRQVEDRGRCKQRNAWNGRGRDSLPRHPTSHRGAHETHKEGGGSVGVRRREGLWVSRWESCPGGRAKRRVGRAVERRAGGAANTAFDATVVDHRGGVRNVNDACTLSSFFLFLTTSKKASVQRRRRDTSGWRPRASERDPPGKNPFVTPTAPLSASRQPSCRPPCVSRGRLAESCARREGRRQRREKRGIVLCLCAAFSGCRGQTLDFGNRQKLR